MLSITGHKGFKLTFDNGITFSVQWGPGNYATAGRNNHLPSFDYDAPKKADFWNSENAEIAIFVNDDMISLGNDEVRGYVTTDEVAKLCGLLVVMPKEVATNPELVSEAVINLLDKQEAVEQSSTVAPTISRTGAPWKL